MWLLYIEGRTVYQQGSRRAGSYKRSYFKGWSPGLLGLILRAQGTPWKGMIRVLTLSFDVRMKDGLSQIIMNVEAQKDEPDGYGILNRAISM